MSSIDGHRSAAGIPAGHTTVLLHEAIENLCIQSGDTVVDATLGGAGHARAIAQKLGVKGILIGFDLDGSAIERTKKALEKFTKPAIHLVNANFRNLSSELAQLGVKKIDKALFDLGWSGYQLEARRGFSFLKEEPLLMTYSGGATESTLTPATIVND